MRASFLKIYKIDKSLVRLIEIKRKRIQINTIIRSIFIIESLLKHAVHIHTQTQSSDPTVRKMKDPALLEPVLWWCLGTHVTEVNKEE